MPDPLEDDASCAHGLRVLEEHLGPGQALRSLGLMTASCSVTSAGDESISGT